MSRDRAWALAKSQTRYNLTTYRKLQARDFGSVATIVTTDFEGLHEYKRGDYQRCLLLSTQNVHNLLYATDMADVFTFPMFIQMFDDDIVSLTALTLIANSEFRAVSVNVSIRQLTLLLYLMTKCQLMLQHLVTSLVETLDCIEVAQEKIPAAHILDHLTLKMTKGKILTYITS